MGEANVVYLGTCTSGVEEGRFHRILCQLGNFGFDPIEPRQIALEDLPEGQGTFTDGVAISFQNLAVQAPANTMGMEEQYAGHGDLPVKIRHLERHSHTTGR